MSTGRPALCEHFRNLRDPRRDHLKQHLLMDIITIAVCGVIGGANTWVDMETFARNRQDWLAQFLQLPNGIPSHDTIERVFRAYPKTPAARRVIQAQAKWRKPT